MRPRSNPCKDGTSRTSLCEPAWELPWVDIMPWVAPPASFAAMPSADHTEHTVHRQGMGTPVPLLVTVAGRAGPCWFLTDNKLQFPRKVTLAKLLPWVAAVAT